MPKLPHIEDFYSKFWCLAFLVASVVALGYRWQHGRTQRQLRAEYFLVDSLQAAADTQRVTLLGRLAVTERRVIQLQLQRDSLDRRLKLQPAARASVGVVIRGLDTVLVGVPDTSGRHADFQSYQPPYTVVARAVLPPLPETPSLTLAIRLDTIPLGLRLGCRPGKPLQTAHAAITSPIWAQVNLVALTQDPAVCNPPRASYGFRVPGVGIKLPWWAPVLGGAVLWEVVR